VLSVIGRAPFGLVLRAARDHARRAETVGVNVRRHQWLAFVIAGFFGGLAGGTFVFLKGSAFPDYFAVPRSVEPLVMVLLGGVHAVDDVGLALPEGEIRALIGPNGAGKTTFFNILTGQLAADAGTVRFRGRSIAGLSPWVIWRLGISRTFQITATFATLSVL